MVRRNLHRELFYHFGPMYGRARIGSRVCRVFTRVQGYLTLFVCLCGFYFDYPNAKRNVSLRVSTTLASKKLIVASENERALHLPCNWIECVSVRYTVSSHNLIRSYEAVDGLNYSLDLFIEQLPSWKNQSLANKMRTKRFIDVKIIP